MKQQRRITIGQLEAMNGPERDALRRERTVTDLSDVSPEFLGRLRADAQDAIERHAAMPRRNE